MPARRLAPRKPAPLRHLHAADLDGWLGHRPRHHQHRGDPRAGPGSARDPAPRLQEGFLRRTTYVRRPLNELKPIACTIQRGGAHHPRKLCAPCRSGFTELLASPSRTANDDGVARRAGAGTPASASACAAASVAVTTRFTSAASSSATGSQQTVLIVPAPVEIASCGAAAKVGCDSPTVVAH